MTPNRRPDPDSSESRDAPGAKQKDYVLNTRLDPRVRDQLADLQRVSPIPRATLRQVLETLIDREWHRVFQEEGNMHHR